MMNPSSRFPRLALSPHFPVKLLKKILSALRTARRLAPEAGIRLSAATLALFALFGFNPQALAATDTWTGADTLGTPTTDWANTDNWSYSSGTGPVASGDSLVFTSVNGQSTATLTDSLTNSSFDINGITFNTGAVGYTMTGNAFALNGNIIDDATAVETINNPISVVAATSTLTMVSGASLLLTGTVSGVGNIQTTGTGAVTFSNLQTTGNLTVGVEGVTGVAADSVVINSGSFGSTSSTLSVAIDNAAAPISLLINGGYATYGTVSIAQTGGESGASMEITGGTSNFTTTVVGGNPAHGNAGNTGGSLTITGGVVNLGTAYFGRDEGSATSGLQLNGSTAVVTATSVNLSSNAGVNHEADMVIKAGSMTIGNSSSTGAFEVGTTSGDGNNVITMSGGALTYLGTDGLLMGSDSYLTMSNGVLTLSAITINSTATGGNGTSEVNMTGGSLYLGGATGGQGIVMTTPGATVFFDISGAILGANANWTSSAPIALTGPSTIQTANSTGTPFNISLSGAISGAHTLTVTGGGILTLSGANTYSLGTTIDAGTLNVASSGALGSAGPILFAGTGGTLQYSTGNATDYSARLGASTAPVSIDTNGQNVTYATALTTTNVADGLNLMDSAGTGSLKLTQPATYTAATSISGSATLIVGSGGSLGNTTVTVNGTLTGAAGNSGISGNVTLNPGGTLSLTGGATGGLTIGGTLGIGGTSASNLDFALSSTGADVLSVTGAVSFGTVGGDINLTSLAGGTAPAFGTMFNLITSTAGDLVPADFTLETTALNIDGTNYTVTLSASTASDEIVTLNQNNVALNFYLTGTDGSSWSKIDTFATDHTGATAQTGSLSSTSNVFLTANSPVNYTSETLDGNYTINSLSFTAAATSPITLANGTATAPLTIEAGSTFSDAANNIYGTGIGLVVQSGAVGHTISANINLGSSQTWEIDNSSVNALTVSGTIGNGSTNDSLTKTGVGTLILSASNTYSGGTIVDAGTVALGTNNALLSTGALTVTGTGGPGGTFDMAGFNQTVGTLSDGGTNTGTVTSSSGTPTLTLNNASTFSGTISGGLALAVNNNLTLSASNSYTGGTTLNAGTLAVSNNYALGGSGTTGLVLDPSASATVQFTSASPTIGSLASSGVGTSSVVLGNSAAPSATTLTIGGAGATTVFGGVISDLTLTNAAAIGNLTVSGGTLTLGGADTFTGTTIISSGGTLVLGNALALQDSTLNYNNQGGTLSLGTQTAMTLAGLTGAQNLALTNTNSAAVAFTIGNNNVTSSYTGVLSGSGSLTKVGSGTFSISNADYIGATTVNAGILTISGGSVGSPTSALSINVGGVALNLTGGMLTAGTVDVGTAGGATGAGVSITGAASASFASLQIGSSGNTGGAVTINTTGTVSLGNYIMGRDGGSGGGASATGGLIIDAGTVTATTIAGGSGVGGRSADINLSGGSFTIGTSASTGAFQLGGTGAVGSDYLTQTGGSLTYLGTDGLVAGALAGTTSGITINGATTVDTLTGVTLNSGNSATTIAALTVGTNATLYLGSAGLVENLPGLSGTGVAVNFGTATVGAIAPWSSAANINLTGNTTFQAADSLGNPNNITLTGTLSGAGGLTTSGAGTVTIANTGSYAGATTVTQGNLVVSGSITGTSAITVSPGANLEVDYLISGASAPAVSGQLSGTGVINGATITSGTLAPGLTLANRTSAVGALTSGGNVTLGSNSTFGIRLGLTNGSSTDVDSLNMAGGSFNLTDSTTTLQLNVGAAEANESLLDTIYTIVNGGASATGVSGDWFANAPGQGDSVTASNGYIFDVYYGVQPGSTITAGNDINVELIAEVPEPGTWASLLGGIGMLVAWQRSRRRRHE